MKTENESTKKNEDEGRPEDEGRTKGHKMADLTRKQLLASVAGNIAIAIISAPSKLTADATGIAEISVDIAEAILKKSGL